MAVINSLFTNLPLSSHHLGSKLSLCGIEANVIDNIIRKNITTNNPGVLLRVHGDIQPLNFSSYSLKERVDLLCFHVKENPHLYQSALGMIALFAVACAIAVVVAIGLFAHLRTLHSDILAGRLVYSGFPYEKVGLEHYYTQRFSLWLTYSLFSITLIPAVGITAAIDLREIKNSFFELHQLTLSILPENIEKDLSSLANKTTEEGIEDPISKETIEKAWAQAPRFIKIGSYLLPLNSLLGCFFQRELVEGQIKHPIESGRFLTHDEQHEVVEQLSKLFAISEDEVTRYFDPYYLDSRKVRGFGLEKFEQDPRYANALDVDKPMILQELLFEDDLSEAINGWEHLERSQKVQIMQRFNKEWFASIRIVNFLRAIPNEILQCNLPINNTVSFTLQDILNQEYEREFQCPIT